MPSPVRARAKAIKVPAVSPIAARRTSGCRLTIRRLADDRRGDGVEQERPAEVGVGAGDVAIPVEVELEVDQPADDHRHPGGDAHCSGRAAIHTARLLDAVLHPPYSASNMPRMARVPMSHRFGTVARSDRIGRDSRLRQAGDRGSGAGDRRCPAGASPVARHGRRGVQLRRSRCPPHTRWARPRQRQLRHPAPPRRAARRRRPRRPSAAHQPGPRLGGPARPRRRPAPVRRDRRPRRHRSGGGGSSMASCHASRRTPSTPCVAGTLGAPSWSTCTSASTSCLPVTTTRTRSPRSASAAATSATRWHRSDTSSGTSPNRSRRAQTQLVAAALSVAPSRSSSGSRVPTMPTGG